jgi:hypothetical protein
MYIGRDFMKTYRDHTTGCIIKMLGQPVRVLLLAYIQATTLVSSLYLGIKAR